MKKQSGWTHTRSFLLISRLMFVTPSLVFFGVLFCMSTLLASFSVAFLLCHHYYHYHHLFLSFFFLTAILSSALLAELRRLGLLQQSHSLDHPCPRLQQERSRLPRRVFLGSVVPGRRVRASRPRLLHAIVFQYFWAGGRGSGYVALGTCWTSG